MRYKLEIEYLFDKTQTSWFYFFTECAKYETAVERAEKYFKQTVSSSGWTKRAKLSAIRPTTHGNDSHRTITPDQPDQPISPSPKRSRRNTSATTKTNAGASKAATNPGKPKANRKNATATPRKSTTRKPSSGGRGRKGAST